ncbi:MAG: circadian clock protein KaiC [Thermoanaerobaculia bacterium]
MSPRGTTKSRPRPALVGSPAKAPTGIPGLDLITWGGLPRGCTTLLGGGPGSGKTIFGLQFLVHGARECREPGIFVAYEESSKRILSNAAAFGWSLPELERRKALSFIDAQPSGDLVQSGDFDFGGLLAAQDARLRETRARRIVFDALDVLLALLPSAAARKREVYRLHEWLLERELTALINLQTDGRETRSVSEQPFGFMQFMVDCAVILNHDIVRGVSHRSLRVQKYRGSGFDEDEAPFLIGDGGLEVAMARAAKRSAVRVGSERVSSGIERLDTMLGGGYFRGASVLITGSPGTAKTTLSGAFAEAACRRGERTLFVSFDSSCAEVVRNLSSVGIRLQRYVTNGILRMVSGRTISGSAEGYVMRVRTLAREHGARCLVIDPVSAWSSFGSDLTARGVADRLIDWAKADGVTLFCTSLLDEAPGPTSGGAKLQVSTLADTWIHLSYVVQGGERNRGLSIIKSRGTAHSNQVRELVLSEEGVTLADTSSAGGEVLMGTMRWEKEQAERFAKESAEATGALKRVQLDAEEAELEVRLKSLQVERAAKQIEKALLVRATESHEGELLSGRSRLSELRGADAAKPERK